LIRSKSGRCAADEFITYGEWLKLAASSLLLLLPIVRANAQSAPSSATVQSGGPTQGSLDEIIVTAQKRQQAITDVGMAITAVSGDQLERQGIKDVGDLTKLEPSFNVSQAQYGTPVYTIRGVGYNEQALAASPAVSVYVDEFPYAYPALTRGATLDLARVEVLKGPQGTLYGQNATGGAINYIAAKPTDSWQGKLEGTYARFNSRDLNGFVSGPLTDTLKARVAFDVIRGGAWQSSYTRDDHIGDTRQAKARILLDWDPAESFKLTFNVNGWVDQSDTPVTQLLAITLLDPQFANFVPNLVNYPLAPHTSRAADWNPAYAHVNDEHFYQAGLRADYSVSSALRITSLTSYEHYRQNNVIGNDGMNVNGNSERQTGTVKSISQELRADGTVLADKLNWLIGLDYARDETNEYVIGFLPYTTPAFAFTPFGLGSFSDIAFSSNPTVKTRAAFGNLEYRIQDNLSVHGGVRYTKSDIDYNGCLYGIDPVFVAGANGIQSLVKQGVGVIPINLGDCVTFDSHFNPGLVRSSLNEHNVSWRTGVDWHPTDGALVYASVSKGYKAGSFPTLPGTGAVQFNPVTQESLLAYEVGLKTTFTPKLALDLSVFHYDYKNKQLRGRILDPTGVFGIIDALVNIPKSEEDGAELSLRWRPVGGLSLSAAATYLDPKVKHGFHTIDVFTGKSTDFTGYGFPATPKWTVASGAQYDWILPNGMNMYFGADYRYQTAAPSVFEDRADTSLGYPSLDIGSYGLLNLRAGVDSSNGKWGIRVFGNNVTNRYYWTEASRIYDTAVRYPGMPVTFGLTATYRFSQ
jgi:outer membrane receptor protein involved in Fe transport